MRWRRSDHWRRWDFAGLWQFGHGRGRWHRAVDRDRSRLDGGCDARPSRYRYGWRSKMDRPIGGFRDSRRTRLRFVLCGSCCRRVPRLAGGGHPRSLRRYGPWRWPKGWRRFTAIRQPGRAEKLRQVGGGSKLIEHGQIDRDTRRPVSADQDLRRCVGGGDGAQARDQSETPPAAGALAVSKVRGVGSAVGHDWIIHPNSARGKPP